jgi:hypothetical protein
MTKVRYTQVIPVCLVVLLGAAFLVGTGCRTGYYVVMEKFGKHKRDLLRQSLADASEQQREVEQQFKDALTRLQELTGASGGELEERYHSFTKEYEKSRTQSEGVAAHIHEVEHVARDLFNEWETELEEIQSSTLKQKSRSKLLETQARFEKMRLSLLKSEQAMEPVLIQMKDYVLYLKHNLNAQAIGSLKDETFRIEAEISQLISEMNRSIEETEQFIIILENEAGTTDQ